MGFAFGLQGVAKTCSAAYRSVARHRRSTKLLHRPHSSGHAQARSQIGMLLPTIRNCSMRAHRFEGQVSTAPSAGTGASPMRCMYFVATRDFCDHLLFNEDGTFSHGSSFAHGNTDGLGSWHLSEHGAGRDKELVLHLQWRIGDGTGSSAAEDFVSIDGGSGKFRAGIAALEHVGGDLLQLPGAQPHKKRGLVFSSVGTQCLQVVRDTWLVAPSELDFDVALVFYKEATSGVYRSLKELTAAFPSVQLLQNAGMKWPNFRYWIETQGGAAALASKYDYIWVVDDDVQLATAEISKMFGILREHTEIKFACPSFDAGSDGVWRFFDGHDPRYKLRYTNFVECTAPVLKTTMLLDPLFEPCLRAVRTGCFIDFCFHPAAGGRDDAVAVIDAVQCHHPPRTASAPSEMRQVMAWHDHKNDDAHFEREGVPKAWWGIEPRYFQPRVFKGIPFEAPPAVAYQGRTGDVLADVFSLPAVGLGTAFYPEDHLRGNEEQLVMAAVEAAVRSGVRLFDCANQYSSQRFVGAALNRVMQMGLVERADLVVIAKIARFDSQADVAAGVKVALEEMCLSYVDVLMPHIPPRIEAWKWFEEEVEKGHARHLGISNYDQLDVDAGRPGFSLGKAIPALQELLKVARIRPAVHEFELHPLLQNKEMVEFCKAEHINILSYSPLGAPHKVDKYITGVEKIEGVEKATERKSQLSVLEHPAVKAIARLRSASAASIVLSWHLQRGFVPIPKSWDLDHIAANSPEAISSLVLSRQEMAVLDAMEAQVRTVVLYHKGMRGEL